MGVIGTVGLAVTASTAGFSAGLLSAQKDLTGFGSSLSGVTGLVGAVGAATVAAGAAAATAIAAWTVQGIHAVDSLNDLAIKTGTTTDVLSGLGHAALLSGSNTEELAAAMTKMEVNLGKIANGGGKDAEEVLKKMGLSASELQHMDPGEALLKISDGLAGLPTKAERAAAEVALLGKAGANLGQMLEGGSAAIKQMTDENAALGGSISQVDANQVAEAADAFDKIGSYLDNLKNQLAIELAPYITATANLFLEWAKEGGGATNIIKMGIEGVLTVVGALADGWQLLKAGWYLAESAMTTGVKMVVDNILLFAKALQACVNILPGMKTDFTSTLEAISTDLDKLAKKQMAQANTEFIAPNASDKIKKYYADQVAAAKAAAEAKAAADAAAAEQSRLNTTGMEADSDKLTKMIDKMKAQIENFGKSGRHAEIAAISNAGEGNPEQVKQAEMYANQLDEMERVKKKQEELEAAGKKTFEATRTPLEKYNAELENLNELLGTGAINQDTFDRASKDAKKAAGLGPKEYKGTEALTQGSAAARSAELKFKYGMQDKKDPAKEAVDLAKQSLDVDRQQVFYIRQLWERNKTPNIVKF